MKTYKELLEAKAPSEPIKGTKEADHKAKMIKGLKRVSEKEFWSPDVVKVRNTYGSVSGLMTFSYDEHGAPLFRGNADFSRGKYRTVYSYSSSYNSTNISLKITQMDDRDNVLAQEYWSIK